MIANKYQQLKMITSKNVMKNINKFYIYFFNINFLNI